MVDVLRDRKRRSRVYNLVVFLMSCTDVVASIGFALSTWPIRKGAISYGAMGNDTTCRIQGFMIEFSQISLLYNLTLSTYFYLTLRHEWSERRLRKYRYLMYGLPQGFGLVLAFAGIPEYTNVSTWCHVDVPPVWDSWLPIVFLVAIPSLTVLIAATTMMGCVYLKVRRQTLRMSRWSFRGKSAFETVTSGYQQQQEERRRRKELKRNRMDRQVFWQAILYLSAFYVTNTLWIYLAIHAWLEPNPMDSPLDIYPAFVLHVTLAPLQGLWNAFIYFRPRMIKRRQQRERQRNSPAERAKRHELSPSSSSSDSDDPLEEKGETEHDSGENKTAMP